MPLHDKSLKLRVNNVTILEARAYKDFAFAAVELSL